MKVQLASTNLVTINGHNLYFETHGPSDAPTVVLLHHGLGSTYAWKSQIQALATNYRLIVYDRWGYGKSEPRSSFSMPYFAQDLQDLYILMNELGVEVASLLGHSDGGTIALYFAAQHPERVSHLVTVAAHIYLEAKMDPGIESLHNAYENDVRFRKGLQRMHVDKTDAVFYNWFNGWTRPDNINWDMRPDIKSITCPTLVVQGIEDEHATPQHARHIAEAIPGAKLWLVPGAHHMLPQEEPEPFNRKILEFLGQRSANELRKDRI